MRIKINKSIANGTIKAQPSKSYSHRLLIAGALSAKSNNCEWVVENIVLSNDVVATINCLNALGIEVEIIQDKAYINNRNNELKKELVFNCGESGSTLRFFIPIALLTGKKLIFKGTEKLISRGIGPYEDIFKKQGINIKIYKDEIRIEGKLKAGVFNLPGNISSQFITGLLFALPLVNGNSQINLLSNLESKNYVDMTIDVLKKSNIDIELIDSEYAKSYKIIGGKAYNGGQGLREFIVEGDYSNAAFIDAFNYIGGNVFITGLNYKSYQGDKVYKELFEKLESENQIIDISNCIDLGPILFCMASLKNGAHFINTSRLKIKESDRVLDLASELKKFNVEVIDLGNEVIINNKHINRPIENLYGHNDHRIVMALSVMLSVYGGVLDGIEAVNKSYPSFFDDIKMLGIEVLYE